ncbi:unnamed protein product [Prorocentrum cordatum]|uniref:DNA2/NAM7 helicase-like C-terminal domain-containing protein n=1 Tax=Prorocentrum cordatum TaxID=2364126 RepID=A0ABN9UV56_9DINO|nr:unnamed protein product [Polarella glacialis]
MHSQIAAFSARHFYDGRLTTGVGDAERPPPLGFLWPQPCAGVAFVDVCGPEAEDAESKTNSAEVLKVEEVLAGILEAKELGVLDVGVVSPYAAQVRMLRERLRGAEWRSRLQRAGVDPTGGLTGRRAQGALEIASVDAFQGREKELIVFSAVRSNDRGSVGFLSDWRRLNVMLTRARRGLIVIGDERTLRRDAAWRCWLAWAQEGGFFHGASATERCASQ